MKLSICTDVFGKIPLTEMLDKVVAYGLDAVELTAGGWGGCNFIESAEEYINDDAKREAFLKEIKSRGLEISALNCSGNPLIDTPMGHEHSKTMRDTMVLAGKLGVDTVVTMSGLPAGAPGDTTLNWVTHTFPPEMMDVLKYQWDVAIKFWSEAADLAKASGVETIALENHPMNLVYNVPTVLKLREAVGDIIGLNLDPSHVFFMGGDPIMMARELCKQKAVYHVHGKDSRINPHIKGLDCYEQGIYNGPAVTRSWNYVAVGYGHDALWWKTFFATLAEGDYHGPVSIEVEDPLMPNNLVAIQKSAAFLHETMLK